MHPNKVERARLVKLTDLPNIGPAGAGDLRLLGIHTPEQLRNQDAFEMYQRLCRITQVRHDPCVLDVFLNIVEFINGAPATPWWFNTAQRKRDFPDI